MAALSDPFGVSALMRTTRYWTATERNTLLPPISGLMLYNRRHLARRRLRVVHARLLALPIRAGRRGDGRRAPARGKPRLPPGARVAPRRSGARARPRAGGSSPRSRASTCASCSGARRSSCCSPSACSTPSAAWYGTHHAARRGVLPGDARDGRGARAGPSRSSPSSSPSTTRASWCGATAIGACTRSWTRPPAPDWAFVVPKILAIALVLRGHLRRGRA